MYVEGIAKVEWSLSGMTSWQLVPKNDGHIGLFCCAGTDLIGGKQRLCFAEMGNDRITISP